MDGPEPRAIRGASRILQAGAVLRHPVSQNAIALYSVQFVLTLLPLVTLPWMARVLGPAEVGVLLFTQSFSFLVGMVIEYGFGLSATRRIAKERHDPEAMAATVAAVQAAKLGLIGVATLVALVAQFTVSEFREDPRLVAFGWAMAALAGLSPFWFFTGVERLRMTAAIDVSVRVLIAVAIVLLVRQKGDGLLVLWIWTLGSAVSTAVLTVMMYREVPLRRAQPGGAGVALAEGRPLFLASASVSLYTTGTVFMLGLVTSSARLAMFAAAERVARVAIRAIGPVAYAAYPRVTYLLSVGRADRAQQISFAVLASVTCFAVVAAVVLYVAAPTVVRLLFGERFAETVGLIRVIALMLPGVAMGSTLSALWLLARGLDRLATRISIFGSLLGIVLTPLLGLLVGPFGVAWLLVVLETGLAVTLIVIIRVKHLVPTWAQIRGR